MARAARSWAVRGKGGKSPNLRAAGHTHERARLGKGRLPATRPARESHSDHARGRWTPRRVRRRPRAVLHETAVAPRANREETPRAMAANSIIVQCLKCNKVLSDSTALVLSDKERKILGVKGASSIQVHEVRDPTRGTRSRAIETTENLRRSAQIDHSRPNALTPSRSVSTLFRSRRRRP